MILFRIHCVVEGEEDLSSLSGSCVHIVQFVGMFDKEIGLREFCWQRGIFVLWKHRNYGTGRFPTFWFAKAPTSAFSFLRSLRFNCDVTKYQMKKRPYHIGSYRTPTVNSQDKVSFVWGPRPRRWTTSPWSSYNLWQHPVSLPGLHDNIKVPFNAFWSA